MKKKVIKEKPKVNEVIMKITVDSKQFKKQMMAIRKQVRLLKKELRSVRVG